MSKYTTIPDPTADRLIEDDLSTIVSKLLEILEPYIQAILLTGGFGRGEGAVLRQNNQYRPVNDYDIVVVTKGLIPHGLFSALPQVKRQLDQQVHVKQVDILLIHRSKLLVPSPTVLRYEICNGHKVLYGSLPHRIRGIPARWIPLCEGTKYFRNRCGGLLIARLLLDGFGSFSERQRLELAALEINKALLVLGDAYLIENHDYHFSYSQRKQIFIERYKHYNTPQQVAELYIRACEEKLRPHFMCSSSEQIDREWFIGARNLEQELIRFEGRRLKTQFRTLEEYSLRLLQNFRGLRRALNKFSSVYNREDSFDTAALRMVAFLLLHSYVEKNEDSLRQVADILGLGSLPQLSWADLTRRFLLRWHPDGIIADITKDEDETGKRTSYQ